MSEVEDTLGIIKECWPQFQILKEDLLNPTQEFVIRFYSKFICDANDKIEFLTGFGSSDDVNKIDLPEERLFQEVSKLLKKICNLNFMLGDIYQPTPIRTKNLFRICIHFIAFLDQTLNEIDIIGSDVFNTREEIDKLLEEQEELLYKISENDKIKAELVEFNINVEQVYKSAKNSYKEMINLKVAKEKLHAEKRSQIESFTWEVQNRDYELNNLKMINKNLSEQKVAESEYENILQALETLKIEFKMLGGNDANMEDGLVCENEVLSHCANCITELSKCDCILQQNVKKLIKKEEELKTIMNTLEKLHTNLSLKRQQMLESEKKLTAKESLSGLQNEFRKLKEHYMDVRGQFLQEQKDIKKVMEEKSRNNFQIILRYKEDIRKLEDNMEQLRKTFAYEYIRVSNVEKRVVDKFNETLKKYGEL